MLEPLPESSLKPVSTEFQPKPPPKNYCHLIPGITGTEKHWGRAKEVLAQAQENGKTIYDSVVVHASSVSEKAHIWKHHEKVGQAILNDIKKIKGNETGGKVEVLVTSLGAHDLAEAIKAIEKITKDPFFFEKSENAQALRLILISPWGFTQGYSEAFQSIGRFGKLVKEMASGGLEMGFNSLQLIKPSGIDASALSLAVTAVDQERVQKLEGYPEISSFDTPDLERQSREYFDKLTLKDQDSLTKIDSEMLGAINKQEWPLVEKKLRERGELLAKPIWNVAGGKDLYDKQPLNLSQLTQTVGSLAFSFLMNAPSIIQSTIVGEPYKKFMELAVRGVEIGFIQPELDTVVPAWIDQRFIDEAKSRAGKTRAVNVKSETHTSTYSWNQGALVKAARELF